MNLVDGVCCILPVKTVLSGSDFWFWQRKSAVKERRGTSDHLVKVSSPENQMETTKERLDNRTSTCDDDDDNDTTTPRGRTKEVWNEQGRERERERRLRRGARAQIDQA